jgi:hypothetical protein
MANGSFSDRLDPATYESDEPVHVCRRSGSDAWIAERLWNRLVTLRTAYQLHLLPLLFGTPEVHRLNGQQVGTLVEEVTFIGEAVTDPATASVIRELLPLFAEATRDSDDGGLPVEGP